jgi:hypothetical protein
MLERNIYLIICYLVLLLAAWRFDKFIKRKKW